MWCVISPFHSFIHSLSFFQLKIKKIKYDLLISQDWMGLVFATGSLVALTLNSSHFDPFFGWTHNQYVGSKQ